MRFGPCLAKCSRSRNCFYHVFRFFSQISANLPGDLKSPVRKPGDLGNLSFFLESNPHSPCRAVKHHHSPRASSTRRRVSHRPHADGRFFTSPQKSRFRVAGIASNSLFREKKTVTGDFRRFRFREPWLCPQRENADACALHRPRALQHARTHAYTHATNHSPPPSSHLQHASTQSPTGRVFLVRTVEPNHGTLRSCASLGP